MTHEFKRIVEVALLKKEKGLRTVLATVVALDGSSYRRPGVRMLIVEDGTMTGAVSGGCVEKEVQLQAQAVFEYGLAKMMTYDGRYRLGCEGILYILLEPFDPVPALVEELEAQFKERKTFIIKSYFTKEVSSSSALGSVLVSEEGAFMPFSQSSLNSQEEVLQYFEQVMSPLFKLIIIGAEHDAVQLCTAASLLGWEVQVVASPKDPRTTANFPGAAQVLHLLPEEANILEVDNETAVVLMNHSYVTDLKFLLALRDKDPAYIGLLGAAKRREKLFAELIEHYPGIRDEFLDNIYGPAGLHIGAETPQEIAISILGEILSVIRKKEVFSLREKSGAIHT